MNDSFLKLLSESEPIQNEIESLRAGDFCQAVPGLRAPLLALAIDSPVTLIVTPTAKDQDELARTLETLTDFEIAIFPAWETLPHERLSPTVESIGTRVTTLKRLRAGAKEKKLVVIASVRAAIQPVIYSASEVADLELRVGENVDYSSIPETLTLFGYSRVDLVTRRGEFAVRGGIIDVFVPTAAHPVRVDFFGDDVDDIREFSVSDQRSFPEALKVTTIHPAREILIDDHVREKAAELVSQYPIFEQQLEKIASGAVAEGIESIAPLLTGRIASLPELLPEKSTIVIYGQERSVSRATDLIKANAEFLHAAFDAAAVGGNVPVKLQGTDYLTIPELRESHQGPWWEFSSFASDSEASVLPSFKNQADGALDYLQEAHSAGFNIFIYFDGPGMKDRASSLLADRSIPATLELGYLQSGFRLQTDDSKLLVMTEAEFFGRKADASKPPKLAVKRGAIVDPLSLEPGDYVVHEVHGIGKFIAQVTRKLKTASGEATEREFLQIEYAPGKRGMPADKLYVPIDRLDRLSRYFGAEEPSLSKMGGSDWAAAKGKARKAVREIAVELVKLYSTRQAAKGYAFGADTAWQRELEDAFPYQETRDQLVAIEEVKADMEKPLPMDRLISGDVGFGKTEIAIRAAFKAVQEQKQVAMLVPTTLLVKQHYETFAARFSGFPVTVRPLSRFESKKDAENTIAGLADGTVDIVIATHRLLSDSVRFKDLGLVVLDEEQRFGVEHKEALKKLKTNVDILAMSATPIPRTLEMAVTGIREMSTLLTPPEDRHPILTYVGPYSEKQVAAAINRELIREGQVFYVHNRVNSITQVANKIAELVPDARVAIAHGQMSEAALEQVLVDFWEQRIDVLVSTTIIETGLDIPNANTLIVDRADKFGLSQLHQLRGRVGRGRERGYAYLFYDADKPLSETATSRLETIASNTDLGSGTQIALRDLELRGAGNLLGAEQSGHITGVGFDLYLRMIGEAVGEFKGEAPASEAELRLELPVDAYLSQEYIDSDRLRLEAYQKLANASREENYEEQIEAIKQELEDRYGALPEAARKLLQVTRIRGMANQKGILELVTAGGALRISPVELAESAQMKLARLFKAKYASGNKQLLVPIPKDATDPQIIGLVSDIIENI
ncbi:MAG: transcription-repair coupling factor [Microbacteriaceae bacterium]|nr:transcription-repair coupling factor [Microbacteriaceae bacterium]